MVIQKAYRLKLQPKPKQAKRLLDISNGCRYVWNYYLDLKKECYLVGGKSPSYLQCCNDLTQLKKLDERQWLSDVLSQPLQQALRDQEEAYKSFFQGRTGFPRFKSRRASHRSFRLPYAKIKGGRVVLERGMSIRAGGTLPTMKSKLASVTFSRDACGTWWASILTEQTINPTKKTGASIGIDLGLKHLAVLSDGRKIDNARPRKNSQERMVALQRVLSRKKKGSNSYYLAKAEVSRLHRRIGNVRSNHLHKWSRRIADENQAVIYCEDLAFKNMLCNHSLAGSIADASWSEFVRQLEYKQRWSGGELVKINRFFPSSKTCSNCHFVLGKLPLSVREWECPRCGVSHDRDVNAAKNILIQGAGCQLRVKGGDGSVIQGNHARVTRPMKRKARKLYV